MFENEATVQIDISVGGSLGKPKTPQSSPVCLEITLTKQYVGSHTLSILSQTDWTFEIVSWRLWCAVVKLNIQGERHYRPSKVTFWKDFRPTNDGWRTGTRIDDPATKKVSDQMQGIGWQRIVRKMKLEAMEARPKNREYLTRMETVKQLFEAFINRSQGFHVANHIG